MVWRGFGGRFGFVEGGGEGRGEEAGPRKLRHGHGMQRFFLFPEDPREEGGGVRNGLVWTGGGEGGWMRFGGVLPQGGG